jgi:hypothetical protein
MRYPNDDGPMPQRKAEALVKASDAKESMMYWHERAMRAEAMLIKLVEALEHKTALHPVFAEARDLIARGFSDNGDGEHG